jgi:hypothetical protein
MNFSQRRHLMKLPEHFSAFALEPRQEIFPLQRLRALQMDKLRLAAYWGIGALVIGFIWSAFLFANQSSVPMFSQVGFPEWNVTFGLAAQTVPREIVASFSQLVGAFTALAQSGSSGQIAGAARFIGCAVIFVGILFTFRRLLPTHYEAHGQRLQYEDHKRIANTIGSYTRRVAVALAVMVSSYVLTSLAWIFLAQVFKGFSALPLAAAFFSALFVGGVTFAAVYTSLTLTTRQLAALGMMTFLLGLGGSFAMAGIENNEQWWQASISRAGAHPNANWLFIAAIGSVGLVFFVLWYDIDQFIQLIIFHAEAYPTPPQRPPSALKSWLRRNTYAIIRALYFLAIIGLLGVGFVRFDLRDIGTVIAHTGGAMISILIFSLGGVGFAYWFPDPILGTPFKQFSIACVLANIIAAVLFAIGILNLAGIELVALIIIGIWFYFALDTVLTYVDAISLPEAEGGV